MTRDKRPPPSSSESASKRRRAPGRTTDVDVSLGIQDDSILFKEVWRVLRRNGWTAKAPSRRSLATLYRYVKPDGSLNGEEGVDYFSGEHALVAYYMKMGDNAVAYDGNTVRVAPNPIAATNGDTVYRDDLPLLPSDRGNGRSRTLSKRDDKTSDHIVQGDSGGDEGGFVRSPDADSRSSSSVTADTQENTSSHGAAVVSTVYCGRRDSSHQESAVEGGDVRIIGSASNNGSNGAVGAGLRKVGTLDVREAETSDVVHRGRDGESSGVGTARKRVARRLAEVSGDVSDCTSAYSSQPGGGGLGQQGAAAKKAKRKQYCDGGSVNDHGADQAMYMNSLVAFSPSREKWMSTKEAKKRVFQAVGSAYITARVCKKSIINRNVFYEIRWLDTMFQKNTHLISVGVLQRGIENYRALSRTALKPSWQALLASTENDDIPPDADLEELVEVEEDVLPVEFDPNQLIPTSLKEVEAVQSMRFDPRIQMEAPTDLYTQVDKTTKTQVRSESVYLFTHSASSSFLAYIPLYFWRQVVNETNAYAAINGIALSPPVTLSEMMKFIGILFFMAINDKGEYQNYWGIQPEDVILGNQHSTGLEQVMPLRRFKLLRACFCFRASPPQTQHDPAARIRPLLNLLKTTGGRYINLGQNVAVDESSVACRSKYGRHCIVFNPTKPTGKYHFRLYMLCCASAWIAVNFRFHCSSDLSARLEGVTDDTEAMELRQEWAEGNVSAIRQLVLEVARPIYFTNRILNTDNYYTSVQLLQALRVKGLYGRGTVRGGSKHFPKHTTLDKAQATRGEYRQGVSAEHKIVAASWWDGNIVQMVSNADASSTTDLERQIGGSKQTFPAPTCVSQYNKYMQGVDRLDQIRGRFSIADGHSYQKWHKKLALALIDIARANAFLTRRLVTDTGKQRDPHRSFMIELASELISGKWAEAPGDAVMFFETSGRDVSSPLSSPEFTNTVVPDSSPTKSCTAVSSRHILKDCGRKKRSCVICRWENRWPTEKTDHCGKHNVCLCRGVYSYSPAAYMCPDTDLTCWEKFHRFYTQHHLFSEKGNLRKLSKLYQLKVGERKTVAAVTEVGDGE